MLLLALDGSLLLRLAARTFLSLLFHEPPRRTRRTSPASPHNGLLPGHAFFSFTFLIQPPSNLPTSTIIRLVCAYWRGVSSLSCGSAAMRT